MALPPEKQKMGQALLAGGPLTVQFLQRELERSGKTGSVLGKALLQSGFPNEDELIALILQRVRIPRINARNTKIPLETIRLLPGDVAKRARALPIDQIGNILVVVTPDLGNADGLAEVRKVSGSLVTPIQCSPEGFDEIVDAYYRRLEQSGMQPAASPVARASTGSARAGAGTDANGVYRAIPVQPDDAEDPWFRRYWSNGPIPAEETLM